MVPWRLGALVRHFEEEQIGELLDVIAIGEAVIAEDVAVVPEFVDEGGGIVCHGWGCSKFRGYTGVLNAGADFR